jgi:hypothetical protein
LIVTVEASNGKGLHGHIGLSNDEKALIVELKKRIADKIENQIYLVKKANQFKTKTQEVCDLLEELKDRVIAEKVWFEFAEFEHFCKMIILEKQENEVIVNADNWIVIE